MSLQNTERRFSVPLTSETSAIIMLRSTSLAGSLVRSRLLLRFFTDIRAAAALLRRRNNTLYCYIDTTAPQHPLGSRR